MTQKLLTIEELSRELGIKKDKINELVEKKIIFAYRIGGELLRFRKEQIDAQRAEIYARCDDSDRLSQDETDGPDPAEYEARALHISGSYEGSFFDRVADFFKFYDFYIVAVIIAVALVFYIFKG